MQDKQSLQEQVDALVTGSQFRSGMVIPDIKKAYADQKRYMGDTGDIFVKPDILDRTPPLFDTEQLRKAYNDFLNDKNYSKTAYGFYTYLALLKP